MCATVRQAAGYSSADLHVFIVGAGASHLLEYMAFKTTQNRSHLRLVREVEAIGGNVLASGVCVWGGGGARSLPLVRLLAVAAGWPRHWALQRG